MRHVIISYKNQTRSFDVPSSDDWSIVVDHLLPQLKAGDIFALSGPLGAGKTTFVQALARELGVKRFLPSPTFALLRTYPLRDQKKLKRLLHVDAYRIEDERDLVVLDLDEEMGDGASLLVIEWPEQTKNWLSRQSSVYWVGIKIV